MVRFVTSWEEVLAKVPTDYLDQCYLLAMRNHDTSYPLGAGEVACVWEKHGAAWIEEERAKAKPEYCARCSGTGMEVVIVGGRSQGSRPCADCNFQRLATWK